MKILCVSTVYKKGDNGRERAITFGKSNSTSLKFLKPLWRITHCNFGILIRNSTLLLI